MAKLVDVFRHDSPKPLSRRQLPLVVDDTLTMVMDLKSLGLVCDSQHVKGKELEEFTRKMNILTPSVLAAALKITRRELMHVLNAAVPCVGCRRSVERLFYQLGKYGHPTLDPIVVTADGIITIREDKQTPHVLCNLFHGHRTRLSDLIDSQIRRNKRSHRCVLHSLDTQRSRPSAPVWRDVWDCMRAECKRDTCIIEASTLHATLETYLRKHRFCGECRTKVLKAYTLLVEEPDPCKEKGYVAVLYYGIKRCLQEKHIHLQTKTEYIGKLIGRAEPELLGRERHAKTLEIAQEEVLTCLGICMYERLHRIYMRMKEEECTCQVFAAVAVDALSRNFETTVERTQGVSQLELLYAELTKEEQQKQLRKEQKKLKRKRKKERLADQDNKDCIQYEDNDSDKEDTDKDCSCPLNKLDTKSEPVKCKSCGDLSSGSKSCREMYSCNGNGVHVTPPTANNEKLSMCCEEWENDVCKCTRKKSNKKNTCDYFPSSEYTNKKECGSSSDHSHDCGYSSENNNGCCETVSLVSSLPSSTEGSEVECSDSCCQPETVYSTPFSYGDGEYLSLQQMLENEDQYNNCDCYITEEEVLQFQNNNRQVYEKRQELRETLQKRFAQLCVNGPMQVPRLLIHKYASN